MQDKNDKNGDVRRKLHEVQKHDQNGEAPAKPPPAGAGTTSDEPVPEILPSGGSGAEERLRAAEHEEGNAPARKGAEKTRDDGEV